MVRFNGNRGTLQVFCGDLSQTTSTIFNSYFELR